LSRFFIILSFKGTNFHGWQSQPGKTTVQDTVKNALQQILQEEILLIGAGRTDSGVHAMNFVAHFDSGKIISKEIPDVVYRLNRFLSYDIIIHHLIPCEDASHSRFDAISRTYHYLVSTGKNPFLYDYSLYYPQKLDISVMNEASKILLVNNDFASFSKLHGNNKTTICEVREAEWRQVSSDLLVFRITADRFLRNMVRAIVGTILGIGSLRDRIPYLQEIIDKKDRSASGTSVDGKGLFLTDIRYKNISLPEHRNYFINESFFF